MYTETRKSTQLAVNERVRTVLVISAKFQSNLSLSLLKKIYFIVIYVQHIYRVHREKGIHKYDTLPQIRDET